MKRRVGILISGRGSNMEALIDACRADDFPARVCVVLSNRADAPGLETARRAGIPAVSIDHKAFPDRESFDDAVNEALRENECEVLCNAGFMRLHSDRFVQTWLNRHLNVHPSILPAYKGLHTHERVLHDGVRISGCSVHLVRTEMDTGPVIVQAAVPVRNDDTPDSLAARVLAAEHRIYPLALRLFCEGRVRVVGEKAVLDCDIDDTQALYSPHIGPV